MDRVYTVPDVARELGVSTDRIRRTASDLGMQLVRAGRARNATALLRPRQRARLRAAIGAVPTERDGRWSRADLQVLTALAQSPRGLVSARAVARRAGVSAATAIKSLATLRRSELVRQTPERLVLGRARDVVVYRADRTTPLWKSLAPLIARTRLPVRSTPPSRRVPNELLHLFWNTHWSQLALDRSSGYVARRLITSGDLDGLAWGAAHLDAAAWRHAAQARGISARRRRLAENISRASAR